VAPSKKVVGVVGAGMVGVATASFLQRAGHAVFLVEPGNPGEGTSFGNAGCLNKSSVVPMSMPGTIRNVPRWLSDPMGPLVIRWRHLPKLTPWLIRFVRAGSPERVQAQARALRGLLEHSVATLTPLVQAAGAADLVQVVGHLFVYRSEEQWRKESTAWALRRDNGIVWDEFNADELRQLDPNLSREYVKGVLIR
jgi:D-amino-acid dehydrogenase